jgi:formate-dependent nitrite reductase cytochrome c552 subunit
MFCHSSFDQYKNQNVTIANATGVSCGVCHNTHDITDSKYADTFSNNSFNNNTWSQVADSKLSFFNATASIAAGTDIFDDLSNRLLYPGTDSTRKDASYGTAPINVTGRPVSEVLCSMCHYRHGLAHTAEVNLTHSRMNYPQSEWATCTDCHMAGTNATVGKDMMKNHANDPLTPNSCGGTTKCHTTSAQNLSASSHSVIPNINEWKASAHNDMEVGVNKNPNSSYYRSINGTTGIVTTASRMNSCDKCHSPFNWNPLTDFNSNGTQNTATVKLTPDNFKGIICAVCHNFHDMGDWLKKTNATFGESKAYAWYNKDAVVAATNATTGAITRYKANYTMMPNTIELCGNCHSNIRIGNEGPGWNGSGGNPTGVHGFPAKDIFVGSVKQKMLNPATNATFECIDCHMATMIKDSNGSVLPDSQKVKGHSFKVNATILMGTNCSNCHKTGNPFPYSDLSTTIEKIQAETRDKWNATNITVQSALAQVKAHSGEKNVSRDLIAKAYWNLRLVSSDESWGVHNPDKTNELLDNATALSNEALTKLGQGGRTITVSPSTATLAINGTQIFNATAMDQNGTPMSGIIIVWASNNTSVGDVSPLTATTDVSGGATTTFTAGAAGIVMITANNGTITGSANVIVTTSISPPTLTTIKVSPPTTSLAINGTQVITATAKDQNNAAMAGINISWTVSNSTVGNVAPVNAVTNASGMATTTFTAAVEGTAMLTATNNTVNGSANVTVTKSTPLPITNPVVISLKVSPSDAGTVTITSPIGTTTTSTSTQITISSGSKVTFNVTPNDGYRFDRFVDKWNGHTFTTSLNPWTDTMVSNDVVTAVFVPTRNTVVNTIRVSPAGAGTVQAVSAVGTTTTPPTTTLIIPVNSKVEFKAIPNKGFKFDHWLDTWGISSSFQTKQNPWTDTMSSSDITTAVFVPIP